MIMNYVQDLTKLVGDEAWVHRQHNPTDFRALVPRRFQYEAIQNGGKLKS